MQLSVTNHDSILSAFVLQYNNICSSIYKHVYIAHLINHNNDEIIDMIKEIRNVKDIAYFEYKFIEGILMEELIKRLMII